MAGADAVLSVAADVSQARAGLRSLLAEFGKAGSTAQSVGAKMDAPLERTAQKAAKASSAADRLAASWLRQRETMSKNIVALGKLDKGSRGYAATLAQMRKQAGEARAALEKAFRGGAIDAKEFQKRLAILTDEMREFGDTPQPKPPAPGAAAGFGKLALKIGAAVVSYQALKAAARTAAEFITSSVEAAQRQEDAENKRAVALERVGANTARANLALSTHAELLQSTTRFSDEALTEIQAFGLSMGVSVGQINQATTAAADLSSALGLTLEEAMRNIARTTGGYAGELGELIPELKDLSKEQLQAGEGIDLLAKKFAGSAARDVETFSGRVDQLKNAWTGAKEEFGSAVTESEELNAAMGDLSARLPGFGAKMAALAAQMAPAITAMVDFASGVLDALTAMDKVDLRNIHEMDASIIRAKDEVKRLATEVMIAEQAFGDVANATGAEKRQLEAMGITTEFAREHLEGLQGELAAAASKLGELEAKRRSVNLDELNEGAETLTGTLGSGSGGGGTSGALSGTSDAAAAAAESVRDLTDSMIEAQEVSAGFLGLSEPEIDPTSNIGSGLPQSVDLGPKHGPPSAQLAVKQDQEFEEATGFNPLDILSPGYDVGEAMDKWYTVQEGLQDGTTMIADGLAALSEAGFKTDGAFGKVIKSAGVMGAKFKATEHLTKMLTQGAGNLGAGLMQMALTGEGSAKKLLKAEAMKVAQSSAFHAAENFALGLSLTAKHDPGAAAAFASAKFYLKTALIAGGAAVALGSRDGGDEKGSSGRDSSGRDFGGDREGTGIQVAEGESGATHVPNLTLVVETLTGTPNEEQLRVLTDAMESAIADAGGGSTLRGG